MPGPAFELSIDTKLLYEALIKIATGEEITYAELGKVISSFDEGSTPCLQSAIRRALKHDGIVFANIRSVGYRRLTDTEIVKNSARDITGVRRRARRAGENLTKIHDFRNLSAQDQVAHNARLSVFSAIALMSRGSAYNKIEQAVSRTKHELPFAETLAAFKKERD